MQKSSHVSQNAATINAERALWNDHGVHDGQVEQPKRRSQADVRSEKLRYCRALGIALELPAIMRELGIAQHGARLNELRRRGHIITNQMTRAADGTIRSSYTLDFDAEAGR
jgi:hypothetical protein